MFAFVVAAAGGLITYRSLMNRSQPAKAAAPSVQIVVAAKDLEVGAMLKDGDVQLGDRLVHKLKTPIRSTSV